MSPIMEGSREQTLVVITARLVQRFREVIEPPVVEETVRRVAGEFADARIWDYVPMFIERSSVESLSAIAKPPSVQVAELP